MTLISTTTKRNDKDGRLEISFVLEGRTGHWVVDEERALRTVERERNQIVEQLVGWDNFTETFFAILEQPNDRIHVHFVYQRRTA